jgi:EAL and modified HD-GYP domain-containing signal transduction protein
LRSRLDALMDICMDELMQQVPLSQDVKAALVRREGDLGRILNEVDNYESGRFDALHWLLDKPYYEVAYRHSCAWAQQVQLAMGR